MNILFICQKVGYNVNESAHCGVGILAELTSSILKKSQKYNFIQCFMDNNTELESAIHQHKPAAIIYSYHNGTTQWLNDDSLRLKYASIPHIMIHYDIHQRIVDGFSPSMFCGFKYVITDDITAKGSDNVFVVPRSLPIDGRPYSPQGISTDSPIIGFQGFGFVHKGIHRIAEAFQNEFDAGTLRLHLPSSYFVDPYGEQARQRVNEVKQIITKPGIKIEVFNQFLSSEGIVDWLSQNDINCYFNDYLDGAGVASSPDYALSARKPIAISKSFQLRHLWNLSPSIIYSSENNFRKILSNGVAPLVPIYEQNAHAALITRYEEILESLIHGSI